MEMTAERYPGVNEHRKIISMRTRLIASAIVLIAGLFEVPQSHAGETLRGVKVREVVRCGVSEGITGFSARDATGRWTGIEADFCRAVAAAGQLAVAAFYVLAMFWMKG